MCCPGPTKIEAVKHTLNGDITEDFSGSIYENIKRQYYILIGKPVHRGEIYMRPEEKDKLFGYTKLSSREEICAGNIGLVPG